MATEEPPKKENPVLASLEDTIKKLQEPTDEELKNDRWRCFGISYLREETLNRDQLLNIRQRIEQGGKWWCLVEQSIEDGFAHSTIEWTQIMLWVKPRL